MKHVSLTKRARVSYALSAVVFICGLVALASGHLRLGQLLGCSALSFAIGVANASGHFTQL
jgi:MFS superfamily sulfate permease-like transporter